MLNYLQTNKISFLFLLPIIGVIIWFQSFYFNQTIAEFPFTGNEMPLYFLISEWIKPFPLISIWLGFALVMFLAFLITRLNKKYMIIEKRTYLLPLFFIIFSAFYIPSQYLHPGLLSSIFLFLAIDSLFHLYKNETNKRNIFNASLFISIGSLFYFNLVYMMIFVWAGMIILQPFKFKELSKSIIGLITPYFITWSIYFISDNSQWFIDRVAINFHQLPRDLYFDLPYYVFFLFLFLFMIIASFKILGDFSRLKIGTRKYFIILFWMFMISVISFAVSPLVFMELMPIVAIPLSFLLTYYIVTIRSFWIGNTITVVALLLLIGIQIFPFLLK